MTVGFALATFAVVLGLASSAQAADSKCQLVKLVELPVTMIGMKPIVTVKINGQETRLIADTGAFFSVLSPTAAARLGIKTSRAPTEVEVRGFGGGETFVGVGKAGEVAIGDLPAFHSVPFVVGGVDYGSDISGLLGQNLLGSTDVEYDLANGIIRLFRAQDCAGSILAYWAAGIPFSVVTIPARTPESPHITAPAKIDGKSIRVAFDTGASSSYLSRSAAMRAGIKLATEGVTDGGASRGLANVDVQTQIVPFGSFSIGDEEIKNPRLRVAKAEVIEGMLLGVDFFLSHRVFVATSQRQLYFTYNGGPVFQLDAPRRAAATSAASAPSGETPADAAGFSRRGLASLARRDYASAAADLKRATELDPTQSTHFANLAMAHVGLGQLALAIADLGHVLELKPDHGNTLVLRARLYANTKEPALALKDLDAAAALPLDAQTRLGLAQLYTSLGRYERAIAEHSKFIASYPADPSLPDALNGRCWARAASGQQLNEALTDCDQAVLKRPRDASFLDSRALVKLRLGRFDESIGDYDAALKLDPKQAWSLYGRGLAKRHKGLRAEGDADVQAAVALDASLPEVARRYGVS